MLTSKLIKTDLIGTDLQREKISVVNDLTKNNTGFIIMYIILLVI